MQRAITVVTAALVLLLSACDDAGAYRLEQERYCGMRALHEQSGGALGWPEHGKHAGTCAP